MKSYLSNINVKFKLFYPVFLGFIGAILFITFLQIRQSKGSIYSLAESNMQLEVKTIAKMFERERELKMEKVKRDLKMAHDLFYRFPISRDKKASSLKATNQINKESHQLSIQSFQRQGKSLLFDEEFPGITHQLFGGTTTIFQKIDSGYLRIATNVLNSKGMPAVGTYIPKQSPVVKTIENGETYYGRAYVVNDWYITAYEPIWMHNEIVGMLYVGDKEKDLSKLDSILQSLSIGKTGYPFVVDQYGEMIINTSEDKLVPIDSLMMTEILHHKKGVSRYFSEEMKKEYILAYDYYPDFHFHIVALVPVNELTQASINSIINSAVLIGVLATIFFILLILTTTTRRVHRLLNAIRLSNIKLRTTKEALKQSEENFRTLFNHSSDEIIVSDLQANILEMNDKACDTLGYTREELLEMNMLDLKPEKFARTFLENRSKLKAQGRLIFESALKTKAGLIIPIETNSRLVEYSGKQVILSISRNLTQRNELERKVLSAVIQTEERERERFSKDMHDGLGPLLSSIKLYVNELGSDDSTQEEKQEYIKQVNEIIDQAVTSTREISNNLMPRIIHEYGMVKALDSFCKKINLTNKILIQFEAKGFDEMVDKNVQLILFRVTTELITNTLKHARATLINIKLNREDGRISLHFEDNGIGFNTEKIMSDKRSGIGLKSIISRIRSINGTYQFMSEVGQGFRIIIEI